MGFHFRKSKKAGPFRFTLSKRGIGWSVGNKYIGYSHGASGRKSLRASIPGTGISYTTGLGSKRKKRKITARRSRAARVKTTVSVKENRQVYATQEPIAAAPAQTAVQKAESAKKVQKALCWAAFVFCAVGTVVLIPDLSFVLFLVFAAICCPIRQYRDWLKKIMPHIAIRIAAAVIAVAVAVLIYPEQPAENTPPEPVETAEEAAAGDM